MLVLLFISTAGYAIAFKRILKLDNAVALPTSISFLLLVLYIAGLADVLKYVVYPLFAGGLVVALLMLLLDRESSLDYVKSPVFCLLSAVYIFMIIVFHEHLVAEYDNFSHWLLNVREIYKTDMLPKTETQVKFLSYPPLSSLWCYYGAKLAGFKEGVLLVVQNFAVLSFMSSVFYRVEWKKPIRIVLSFAAMFAMTCVIWANLTELYVDTFLGAAGVFAAFVICSEKTLKRQYIPIYLAFSIVTLIKNTGIAFAYLLILFWIVAYSKKNLRNILLTIPVAVLPILSYFSFSLFIKARFSETQLNASPFSSQVYQNNMNSGRNFSSYIGKYFGKIFDTSQKYIFAFLVLMLVAFVLTFILCVRKKEKRKDLIRRSVGRLLFVAAWTVILYILYITMFTEEEIASFAAFERYFGTMIIIYIGLLALNIQGLEREIVENKSILTAAGALWLMAPIMIFHANYYEAPEWMTFYHEQKIEGRKLLIQANEKYGDVMPDDATVYVVLDEYIDEKLNWIYFQYEFESEKFNTLDYFAREYYNWKKDGIYVLNIAPTDSTDEYLTKNNNGNVLQEGLYIVKDGAFVVVE